KVIKLFCSKKYVDLNDISNSYTKVSGNYNNSFLNQMHKYNEEMLENLISQSKVDNKKQLRVLDLACGTGFNSDYLNKNIKNLNFTLVDISSGMLTEARKNEFDAEFIEKDMLSYLEACEENTFDIVICAWAIKYQNPHKVIKGISKVLKKNGQLAVIVNLKSTLSEVRKVYPKIIGLHGDKVNKLMLELPNPISEKSFNSWFTREKFTRMHSKADRHKFIFETVDELVNWLVSTGALAGFDIMIDMTDKEVQKTMVRLFTEKNINYITHKFVWGTYRNDK
ncbi:MAG: class I SAM-dependent methyltransferase, partial [Sarcina sp.]